MNYSLDEIESIFTQAIALPEGQRDSFIEEQCAGRPTLLEEVQSLLLSEQKSDDVLELPATQQFFGSPEVVGEFSSGDTIGNYRLLQEIGAGGMGVVFMAQQMQPIKRKVALKIIKLGMDTKNVIARFESERQALALMEHPSITKVLDAGSTPAGRPFFVMELVYGKSIKKYCNAKKLSLRKRIELFIQVCTAVHHAHQKGVIHRDIKPSNILVTSQDGIPVPKVIDFGIAKATEHDLTDKTCFTSFGDMIGTVDYMSPEQAEVSSQDIDTRSDIYSLGVVLYEMLTGTTPYKNLQKLALPEIRRTIKSVEPERPSTRAMAIDETAEEAVDFGKDMSPAERRSLQGELDWVILKCLEKDRRRRYDSAAELAKDLQRFLDGEPVEAAAPSVWYKLKKFAAKNRAYAATAFCCFAMLLFVAVFSSIVAYQSAMKLRQANEAKMLADQELRKVSLNYEKVDLQHQLKKRELNETMALLAEAKLAKQQIDHKLRVAERKQRFAESKVSKLYHESQTMRNQMTVLHAISGELLAVVEGGAATQNDSDRSNNRIPKLVKIHKKIQANWPIEIERPKVVTIQLDQAAGGLHILEHYAEKIAKSEIGQFATAAAMGSSGSRSAVGSTSTVRSSQGQRNEAFELEFFIADEQFVSLFEDAGFRQRFTGSFRGSHGNDELAKAHLQLILGKIDQKHGDIKKARTELKKGYRHLRNVQNVHSPFDRRNEVKLKIHTQLELLEMDLKAQDWESAQKHWNLFDYSKIKDPSLEGSLKELRKVKKTIENVKRTRSKKASHGN